MRSATIAGVRCLAMMEETIEQLKRQDGSVEEVRSWKGRCRVPGPYTEQILNAALALEAVSYRGPLRREGGRVEEVEGQVMIEPSSAGAGGPGSNTGGQMQLGHAGTDHFKLTGTGSPTVVDDE